MRQIKFRGRHVEYHDEIYYGFYEMDARGNHFIIDSNNIMHIVDPESVAQLVGHDSNGNEVYEGDTVVLNSDDYPLEYKAHLSGYATGDRGIYISAERFGKVTLKEAAT